MVQSIKKGGRSFLSMIALCRRFLEKVVVDKGGVYCGVCFFGFIVFPSAKPAMRTIRVPRMPAISVEMYGFAIVAIV